MPNTHPAAAARATATAVTDTRSAQTTPGLPPASRWASGRRDQRTARQAQESKPATNKANISSWETIALWVFIAGIFIASVVAGYLFWLKLTFRSP